MAKGQAINNLIMIAGLFVLCYCAIITGTPPPPSAPILELLLLILQQFKQFETFENPQKIDLVIARYEEDIDWIKNIPVDFYSNLYIYNKGSPKEFVMPKSHVVNLSNVGREGHTYLHHIHNNYNNLGDITIFIPGSANTFPNKKNDLSHILEYLKNKKTSAIRCYSEPGYVNAVRNFSIDNWQSTSKENVGKSQAKIEPSEHRPLIDWYKKHFQHDSFRIVSHYGVVAASREDIHKRPPVFYKSIMDGMLSPNPETGHYVERTWKDILSIADNNCF